MSDESISANFAFFNVQPRFNVVLPCHLCEDVKRNLVALRANYPHLAYQLHEIDIAQDKALFKKYCLTIPVLKIGTKTLEAPIEMHQLVHILNLKT